MADNVTGERLLTLINLAEGAAEAAERDTASIVAAVEEARGDMARLRVAIVRLKKQVGAMTANLGRLAERLPVPAPAPHVTGAHPTVELARAKWVAPLLRAIPFIVVGIISAGAALGIKSCVAVENKLPTIAAPAPPHEATRRAEGGHE